MAKQREHREWFWPLSHNKCRNCGTRWPNETYAGRPVTGTYREKKVWGWYEYVRAKKRLVRDVCPKCVDSVETMLKAHADPCGCKFVLVVDTCMSPLEDVVRLRLFEIEKALNATEVCDA